MLRTVAASIPSGSSRLAATLSRHHTHHNYSLLCLLRVMTTKSIKSQNMTTPPHRLIEHLPAEGLLDLRHADGTADEKVTISHAISLAIQGVIEGVGPPSGRISFVRHLPKSAQPTPANVETADPNGDSTAFARTNMGVFREAMREAIVQQDCFGNRVAIASGEVMGHVWTHCAARATAPRAVA